MGLFQHQRGTDDAPVPGLAENAAARGWQPAPEQPFDRELHDTLYDLACDIYGQPGVALNLILGENARGISFHYAFRLSDAGRTVTVANARAGMPYAVRYVAGAPMWIAVCAGPTWTPSRTASTRPQSALVRTFCGLEPLTRRFRS